MKEVPLKTLVKVIGGYAFKSDDFENEGHPIIRISNIGDENIDLKSAARIPTEKVGKGRQYQLDGGDILIAMSGATTGKIGVIPDNIGETLYLNQRVGKYEILDKQKLCPRYLLAYIRSDQYQNFVWSIACGAAQPNISGFQLVDTNIPLPPLEEQKQIAAILDQADALRKARRRSIERLNELSQSIFYEMFGEPIKQLDERGGQLLGQNTTKIGSGATPKGGESAYKNEGTTLVRSMNVRDGYFTENGLAFIDEKQASELNNVVVQKNDVLLNITGASVARVCRMPECLLPARVNQHVAIIRPTENLQPEFLEQQLLFPSYKQKLLTIAESGATRQAITKSEIENLPIVIPPIDLQSQFVAQVKKIEKIKAEYQKHNDKLDSLFKSFQQLAFRGELSGRELVAMGSKG